MFGCTRGSHKGMLCGGKDEQGKKEVVDRLTFFIVVGVHVCF